MSKNKILKESLKLINKLNTGKCFVVGGYIRNLVMGQESSDVDFVIENIDAARDFADKFNCNYYILNMLHRVEKHGFKWDFIKLEENIKENLAKRDFTCDSMAIELKDLFDKEFKDNIIDPFEGLKDINLKLLKPTSLNIFSDDYIRIIRAYRLKEELKFNFTDDLENLILQSVDGLKNEKSERICHELEKLFSLDKIDRVIREMADNKIFINIYPGTREIKKIMKRWNSIEIPLTFRFILMIAIIWKDEGIAERLKISKSTQKILKEILSLNKEIFQTWLLFKENTEIIYKARYIISGDEEFLRILNKYKQNLETTPIPVISGNKVMEILNLNPSPAVGIILKDILKAQFEGKISSVSRAIEYVSAKYRV